MAKLAEQPETSEPARIDVVGRMHPGFETVLAKDALRFVGLLVSLFEGRRTILLEKRAATAERIRQGILPDFLPETDSIRKGAWTVGPIPKDLSKRRVEIT